MTSKIDRGKAGDAAGVYDEASALLEKILREQADWKVNRGFYKPKLRMERDPLLLLFVVAFVCFAAVGAFCASVPIV